jgi:hypothetical protein
MTPISAATLVLLAVVIVTPAQAAGVRAPGLSHLSFPERGEQSGQEGVVPSCSFELSLHGAF